MKRIFASLVLLTLAFNMCFASAEAQDTVVDDNQAVAVAAAEAGITITSQPENVTTPEESSAVFKVVAEGEGLTYQWEYMPNATWMKHSAASATSAELTFTARSYQSGYKYRCVITDANGVSVTTDVVTLTIGSPTELTVDEVVYRITGEATVEVVEYQGVATSVTIPDMVYDYSVTAIAESAFEGNVNLASIDLPDTITVIGKRAFANCTNLTTMN